MKITPASAARFSRTSVIAAALGSMLFLAGCGGGGSSSTTDTVAGAFPTAYVVIGQKDFSTISVNQGSGTPGAGTLAQPTGAVGTTGSALYVPDLNNNRLLGFNSLPTVNNTTANFAVGQLDFTSNSSATPPSASSLKLPGRAWVASSGQLVVADTNNNRVLIWNTAPTSNASADVVVGQNDFVSSSANQGGAASAATLNGPTAAVIANGKLIVVDSSNNRVLIWNSVPTANGAAADVVIGQPDLVSSTANNPCTIAIPNCGNSAVTSQYNLNQPLDVWANDTGRLLIADTSNNRVLYWKQIPTSNFTAANYVLGKTSFTTSSFSTSSTGMNGPNGVGSDGTRIYVADTINNRVLVFNGFPTSNGEAATTVIGQNNFTNNAPNDDNQTNSTTASTSNVVSARTLNKPTAATIVSGKLFVTDSGNNRVLGFNQ